MTRYSFNGASDDLVEFSVDGRADEKYTPGSGAVRAQARLTGPDGSALVVTLLLDGETWHAAVGQPTDEAPLPNWPITIRQAPHCDYATEVVIDAPDGTDLSWHVPD